MDTTHHWHSRGRLIAVTGAFGMILFLGACGDDDDAEADDAGAPPAEETDDGSDEGSGSDGATLEITESSFTDVSVTAGGTLEVVNESGAGHTFTADDGAFDEAVGDGDTVEVTVPSEPGEYPFHCEIHPSMQATLTVQ